MLILTLIVLALVLLIGGIYNGLVRLKVQCDDAWADIDVQLKRRYDLIPNVVEAVNGQLERLRRNNGGYFQSEDNLHLKLAIAMRSLEDGKWARPCADARSCIDQLNALFARRFETEA